MTTITFTLTSIDDIETINERIAALDPTERDTVVQPWQDFAGTVVPHSDNGENFTVKLPDGYARWTNRDREWSEEDIEDAHKGLAEFLADRLEGADLEFADAKAIADTSVSSDGDIVVTVRVVEGSWSDDVADQAWEHCDDAVAEVMRANGMEFTGDAGGCGGPWLQDGDKWVGFYQRWTVA